MNNNIYIINLQASHIFNKGGNYSSEYINKDGKKVKTPIHKLYTGSLPPSMTLDRLIELGLKIKNKIINDVGYHLTDNIINVKFDYTGEENKKIISVDDIRTKFYKEGFNYNNKHYVQWERTSSKSRGGSDLFILEKYKDAIELKSNVGLEFKETDLLDIASCRAYQSLTQTEKKGYIKINPKTEILLIDDLFATVKDDCYVTTWNEELKQTETNLIEDYEVSNCIFDGECLLSSEFFNSEGCKLLRNDWYKSNGINCNIQDFFNSHKELIKDGIIYDMFGRKLYADNIKMICTPSSIKFLKLSEFKFKDDTNKNETKFDRQKKTYLYWLEHIENKFAVVMSEEESKFGDYNQLSYQMVNSFPNLSKDEIRELAKDELDYILQLKNDISVFKHHISCNDLSESRQMIYNLLSINDDIEGTDMFKEYKNNTINEYKDMLRTGKIKIDNTDYSVCFGNPIELLWWSLGVDLTKDSKYLGKQRVYCPRYQDNEKLMVIRNPHVATNNIVYGINCYEKDFEYFNLTDNTVVIDSIHNNFLHRLNGLDFDIDKVIISSCPTLVQKSFDAIKYPTPVNMIESKLVGKEWTQENIANVDATIAKGKSMIGEIINLSQQIQSIMWEEYNKENPSKDYIKFLNKQCCTLANISNIAIDKAKKTFPKELDLKKELTRIREIKKDNGELLIPYVEIPKGYKVDDKGYIRDSNNKKIELDLQPISKKEKDKIYKRIRPKFFQFVGEGKDYYFKSFNTPMDYLQEILSEHQKGVKSVKHVDLTDVINFNDVDFNKANRHQIKVMINFIKVIKNELDKVQIKIEKCKDNKEKAELIKSKKLIKDFSLDKIKKQHITVETIKNLFKKCYIDKIKSELRDNRLTLLGMIYKTHTELCNSIFIESKEEVTNLVEDAEGKIVIWGKKYSKIKENFHANIL